MPAPLWATLRQPASFRGIQFAVEDNSWRRGRQIALHTYAFRDDPWPEDLGRSSRITSFRGFVVGDDCDAQIRALEAAVETAGPGPLVHPYLGSFSAQVLEFTASDAVAKGRSHTFDMTIVPYVPRIYPVATADTQAQTQFAAPAVLPAVASDFATVQQSLGSAVQVVQTTVGTVGSFVAQASSLVNQATSLAHLPVALAGNFGRFAGGGLASGAQSLGGGVASIAQAASLASTAASSVTSIGAGINRLAGQL